MKKQIKNRSLNNNFFNNLIYVVNGVFLLILIFLFLQIKNINSRLENIEKIINPQQQEQTQIQVKLDQVKKLFTQDFIHFGDASKKLLIVEVSDPSCPFCHIAGGKNPELASQVGDRFKYQSDGGSYIPPVPEIKKLVDEGKASFAFIYSNGHGNGRIAAEALYCAYEKGKFWEVHDKLMTNAGYNLINEQVKNDRSKAQELVNFVADVIDPQFLSNCLSTAKYEKNLARDEQISPSLGFQGTPHFVFNTKIFQGAYSFSNMKSEVDKYL
jgi:protein-disulfide isomerase